MLFLVERREGFDRHIAIAARVPFMLRAPFVPSRVAQVGWRRKSKACPKLRRRSEERCILCFIVDADQLVLLIVVPTIVWGEDMCHLCEDRVRDAASLAHHLFL